MITIIAAAAQNNALGKDNQMIWHLPDDFRRFKALTTGHHIIMGRKTFESLPGVLANRTHVIITRQKKYSAPQGCLIADSLEDAIAMCPKNDTVFIIGGGEIYRQSMVLADRIELTKVMAQPEADTFFPEIAADQWKIIAEEFHPKDEKHAFDFAFITYERV